MNSQNSPETLEELLASISARIRGFSLTGNPDTVLDGAVSDEAGRLWHLAEEHPDREEDVRLALGCLHWSRHQALNADSDSVEMRVALSLLGPLYQKRPESLPEPLRGVLARKEGDKVLRDHFDSDAEALNSQAVRLLISFRNTRNPADLNDAVDLMRRALEADSGNRTQLSPRLTNLASVLASRYGETRQLADLDEAVSLCRQAMLSADTDPVHTLMTLGTVLRSRFEHQGGHADLDEAISVAQKILAVVPDGAGIRTKALTDASAVLFTRYRLVPDSVEDLDQAVRFSRQALQAVPPGHAAGTERANLGMLLSARYERLGLPADIEESIELGWQAGRAVLRDDPSRLGHLTQRAQSLQGRYHHRTGDLSDLDEAIASLREAHRLLPGDPDLLDQLGQALATRFQHAGQDADLAEAVRAGRAAISDQSAAATLGHHLGNLARSLHVRFGKAQDLADLDEAIELATRSRDLAVQSRQAEDNRRTMANLGGFLAEKAMHTSDHGDIARAIAVCTEAVSVTPAGHRYRGSVQNNLAQALQLRFERDGNPGDAEDAFQLMWEAARFPGSSPSDRMKAATDCGHLAAKLADWRRATDAFAAGVQLLPHLASADLDRPTRTRWLGQAAGVGRNAIACAIHAGDPHRAFALAEQSRAVLLSEAMQVYEDLSQLRAAAPALAERFVHLRNQLGHPLPDAVDPGALRRRLLTEYEQALAEIRQVPGFQRFLAPPDLSDLADQYRDGPVVLVNHSHYGSHALVMTAAGLLEPVALPDLTQESLASVVGKLLAALAEVEMAGTAGDRKAFQHGQSAVMEVLSWLGHAIGRPVLDRLGYTAPGGGPPRRIWWMPTGALGLLPIHAAQMDDANMLDVAVSSYTPTVRALRNARGRERGTRPPQTLVVAMPATPNFPPLPGALAESASVVAAFPGTSVLTGEQATRDRVVQELRRHTSIHLACHGIGELFDTAGSAVLLHDQPLTATEVAQLRLDEADLAFLSACETARFQVELADEVIHLGSAFQAAGYRHVIATLWQVDDAASVPLTEQFYTQLADREGPAAAIRRACLHIRDQAPHFPAFWAAYIHTGP